MLYRGLLFLYVFYCVGGAFFSPRPQVRAVAMHHQIPILRGGISLFERILRPGDDVRNRAVEGTQGIADFVAGT